MTTLTPDEEPVVIHADGACRSNPGPGGWAVVLQWQGYERELSGHDPDTTNNRMELMAVIQGLLILQRPSRVHLVVDSTYVRDGATKWIPGWKNNGWQTRSKQPVKNVDLWQALDTAMRRHTITWEWVKGHSGHPGNERADALASAASHGRAVT